MRGGFIALPRAEVHVHLEGCFVTTISSGSRGRMAFPSLAA